MPDHAAATSESLSAEQRVELSTEIDVSVAEYWEVGIKNAFAALLVAVVAIVLVYRSRDFGLRVPLISPGTSFIVFGVVGAAAIALQVAVRDRRNARDVARAFALETVAIMLAAATAVVAVLAVHTLVVNQPVDIVRALGVVVAGSALFAIAIDGSGSTADLRTVVESGIADKSLPSLRNGAEQLRIDTTRAC